MGMVSDQVEQEILHVALRRLTNHEEPEDRQYLSSRFARCCPVHSCKVCKGKRCASTSQWRSSTVSCLLLGNSGRRVKTLYSERLSERQRMEPYDFDPFLSDRGRRLTLTSQTVALI